VAIYKENLTVKGKKAEAQFGLCLECDPLFGKSRLPVANFACRFYEVAVGFLLT